MVEAQFISQFTASWVCTRQWSASWSGGWTARPSRWCPFPGGGRSAKLCTRQPRVIPMMGSARTMPGQLRRPAPKGRKRGSRCRWPQIRPPPPGTAPDGTGRGSSTGRGYWPATTRWPGSCSQPERRSRRAWCRAVSCGGPGAGWPSAAGESLSPPRRGRGGRRGWAPSIGRNPGRRPAHAGACSESPGGSQDPRYAPLDRPQSNL